MIEFRDVPQYEGLYRVNKLGEVKGVKSGKTLKYSQVNNRYYRVRLYKNANGRDFFVHRLVAMAFVPNPENKPQVNHKDGNIFNNNANNLEWVTQGENNKHAFLHGLNSTEKAVEATRKKVYQKDLKGNVVNVWRSLTEAARAYNLKVPNISNCCKGRIKSTGGYVWSLEI